MPNSLSNCLIGQFGLCIKCDNDHELIQGACIAPFESLLDKCDSHNLIGATPELKYHCNRCDTGSLPFDYKNSFMCVSEDKFEDYSGQNLISNCLQYFIGENGVYHCASCSSGVP